MTINNQITEKKKIKTYIPNCKYKYFLLAMRLTCEILPKVLLQFNCLVKDFIGLLICLPLIHLPESDSSYG